MEGLVGYIAVIVVSLIVGYLMHWVEPRSKLQAWSPHNFSFNLGNNVTFQTNSIAIYNAGRRPAKDLEIIHGSRPQFFQLWPSVPYTEDTTPGGEHVIKVESLGPREGLFLQLLSSTYYDFRNLRWEGGPAQWIPMQFQRVRPSWLNLLWLAVTLVGAGFITYWLIRFGVGLSGVLFPGASAGAA